MPAAAWRVSRDLAQRVNSGPEIQLLGPKRFPKESGNPSTEKEARRNANNDQFVAWAGISGHFFFLGGTDTQREEFRTTGAKHF